MLKMTRLLFAIHPDVKYAEFEERALFNHILASIDPEDGRTCYMVPIGRGVQHEYQDMFRGFTCCVGSGMESHGLHGDGIYYESADRLWINIYVPSTATWQSAGVNVSLDTTFPEGDKATLKLTLQKPREFTLALRRPSWAGDGFEVKVNGEPIKTLPRPGSYVEVKRTWKTGDSVALVLPKVLHIEGLADNPNRAALMWGPLVLAGDLGSERRGGPAEPVPSLVTAGKPVTEWLLPVRDSPGVFRTSGVGRTTDDQAKDVDFIPFYRLHRRTYGVYWDLYTPDGWTSRIQEVKAEKAKLQKLEAATVAFLQPGDPAKEKSFNQQGEESTTDRNMGRTGRRARKWFSYDLPLNSSGPLSLVVTYTTEERAKRTFAVLMDSQRVAEETIARYPPGSPTGKFFEVEYEVPADLIKNKLKLTIRFEASGGNETATVFGIRIIRADEK